jgi:hypothetical protein
MLFIGLDEIAKLFGKSRWTIARWIKQHGLKARRLPDGQWITSTSFIDDWIAQGHKADPLVTARRYRAKTRCSPPKRTYKRKQRQPVAQEIDSSSSVDRTGRQVSMATQELIHTCDRPELRNDPIHADNRRSSPTRKT